MWSLVIQVTMIFTTLAKSNSRKKLCVLILDCKYDAYADRYCFGIGSCLSMNFHWCMHAQSFSCKLNCLIVC